MTEETTAKETTAEEATTEEAHAESATSITVDLPDAELAALAAELCAAVLAQPRAFAAPWAQPPLADGPADQVDTIGNPYWQVIRNLPIQIRDDGSGPTTMWLYAAAEIRERVRAAGLDRDGLSRRYSWSIPSPGDIAWIAATAGERGVVEIGAGGGYWAWLMRAAGVDTLAYDPFAASARNGYAQRAYTAVEPGDDSVAAHHGDRALFLCWPSNNEPWAARALTAYRGDLLIYAGQDAGGCTADDRFFDILDSGWERVDTSAAHVTYVGVPCRLTAWRR